MTDKENKHVSGDDEIFQENLTVIRGYLNEHHQSNYMKLIQAYRQKADRHSPQRLTHFSEENIKAHLIETIGSLSDFSPSAPPPANDYKKLDTPAFGRVGSLKGTSRDAFEERVRANAEVGQGIRDVLDQRGPQDVPLRRSTKKITPDLNVGSSFDGVVNRYPATYMYADVKNISKHYDSLNAADIQKYGLQSRPASIGSYKDSVVHLISEMVAHARKFRLKKVAKDHLHPNAIKDVKAAFPNGASDAKTILFMQKIPKTTESLNKITQKRHKQRADKQAVRNSPQGQRERLIKELVNQGYTIERNILDGLINEDDTVVLDREKQTVTLLPRFLYDLALIDDDQREDITEFFVKDGEVIPTSPMLTKVIHRPKEPEPTPE